MYTLLYFGAKRKLYYLDVLSLLQYQKSAFTQPRHTIKHHVCRGDPASRTGLTRLRARVLDP